MSRILVIAWREFSATAMTKGFLIGAVGIPLLAVAMIPLIIFLIARASAPEVSGTVAVIDGTGLVTAPMAQMLSPEAIAARERERQERVKEFVSSATKGVPVDEKQLDKGVQMSAASLPKIKLDVEGLGADADLEQVQSTLRGRTARQGGRLAVVVVDPDAVIQSPGKAEFGGYQIFHVSKLDDRVLDEVRLAARESIRTTRLTANGMDPARIKALNTVEARKTQEVTEAGTGASTSELAQILPIAFMILLITSVIVGGQYLLTTTIEEKSNRVVEVLLSAVSPMQLMAGKILGQMGVGLTLLVVYSGVGMSALAAFALMYLVDAATLVYLFVFFIIAYFLFASMLAAVGSAVNDLREAQSLQTPVMLTIMIPYFLWMPISRDPDSLLSVTLSMVPPMSPFVMMLRLTSTSPPPTWQVLVSIGVGLLAVYGAVWAAAKIFRVGLLMYGKPPNLRTLIKWVRMA
jgi:ABC-2 type transport system permease protein